MKLFLKVALFTVVMPGTVAVLVPVLLGGDRTIAGGALLGLATCLFALGSGIYLRAVWDFAVLGKGTPAPIDAPKRLVVRGIYRYSRNPLYVAMLILVAGWAALFGTAVPLAYAVGLFVMYSLVIRFHEEPHLAREFGDEYKAYVAGTGRWLPRIPLRKVD